MPRFAVIADVHGNALALEAVLLDVARRGAEYLVNLGDNANGPLEPARSVALLRSGLQVGDRAVPMFQVRGNGDRMVGEGDAATRSARFARERLSGEATTWLRELPLTLRRDGWFACHGSPTSDTEYLVECVTESGAAARPAEEIAARLAGISESLVLCGHTHLPRNVRLPDGRLVVNPGSVGLPAYHDAAPFPHVIEAGSPDARYALVDGVPGAWRAELLSVPYDFRAAAALARTAGWAEWAYNLETGRCATGR